MLVLSRKIGDQIIISQGDVRIVLEVNSVRGSIVKIGIVAPQDWVVNRGEVQAVIDAEKGIASDLRIHSPS